ncbi:MAG: FhaA domain-containing protein [Chloroflexota bacterium]
MSRLEDALARIESRLRAMVEGGTARLFSIATWGDGEKCSLAALLLQALHDHAETNEEGVALAPNQFTLHLPPTVAQLVRADPDGIDELASYVYQCGCESGFVFVAYPTLEVRPEVSMARGEMRLEAQIFPRRTGGNTAMLVNPALQPTPHAPEDAFLIVNGQWTFPLEKPVINIGRRTDNDLVLNDPRVSRAHAQLRLAHSRYMIFDLGSTGGTFVNGQRVTHSATLLPGDVVSLAGVTLIFGHDSPVNLDDTTELPIS